MSPTEYRRPASGPHHLSALHGISFNESKYIFARGGAAGRAAGRQLGDAPPYLLSQLWEGRVWRPVTTYSLLETWSAWTRGGPVRYWASPVCLGAVSVRSPARQPASSLITDAGALCSVTRQATHGVRPPTVVTAAAISRRQPLSLSVYPPDLHLRHRPPAPH